MPPDIPLLWIVLAAAGCVGISCSAAAAAAVDCDAVWLQSYPEFCRSAFDTADDSVREAVVEMERRYGKVRHLTKAMAQAALSLLFILLPCGTAAAPTTPTSMAGGQTLAALMLKLQTSKPAVFVHVWSEIEA